MSQRFGEYWLDRRLGAGGMAETYVARRERGGGFTQQVCLKRILPNYVNDEDFTEMFLDEARLAARMRHSSVVQVLDFGLHDGAYYLALELIDGLDLRSLIQRTRESGERLPQGISVYIVEQVAHALDHAHHLEVDGKSAGVVHRDVSPSNILLSRAGEVKLADFGIAKAAGQTHETVSGIVRGKAPYMAPEQALTGDVDARTDIFALGVVLYELLCGTRPFDGPTDVATILNISRGHRASVTEHCPHCPPALVDVVDRCLAVKPSDRMPSAAALIEALGPFAGGLKTRRTIDDWVNRFAPRAPVATIPFPLESVGPTASAHAEASDASSLQSPSFAPGDAAPVVATKTGLAAPNTELPVVLPGSDSQMRLQLARTGMQRLLQGGGGMLVGAGVAFLLSLGGLYAWQQSHEPSEDADTWLNQGTVDEATEDQGTARDTPTTDGAEATTGQVDHAPAAMEAEAGARDAASDVEDGARNERDPTSAAEPATAPGRTNDPALQEAASQEAEKDTSKTSRQSAKERRRARREQRRMARRSASQANQASAQRNDHGDRNDHENGSRGTVTIVVLPYGRVALDGGPTKTAPQTFHLTPGRHKVGYGLQRTEQSTSVQVIAGEKKQVVLRAK